MERLSSTLKSWRMSGQLRATRSQRQFIILFIAVSVLLLLGLSAWHRDALGRHFTRLTYRYPYVPTVQEMGPPTYERLREWEDNLPQHNPDLPYPEGRTGRYVKFSNQIKMLGWNNVFNELLMNALLAYKTKRAYVFIDYVWKNEYYAWPEHQFRDWPPRTPLNAIISGPMAGGPWDEGDDAPRSVSEKYYDIVCPESERRIFNTRDVKPAVQWSQGNEIFAHWEKLLLETPERCVEIIPAPRSEDGFPQTFDLWLWGSDRILSLWDMFSKSPISRLLATSPLVRSAVDRNEYLFHPTGPKPPFPVSRNPFDRMLAVHIRRGDYKDACIGLATWNSTFYSWNLLPELPDRFIPPPGGKWGENTPENTAKYLEHCLPTFDAIVQKVHDSRVDYVNAVHTGTRRYLDVLYLLTNEESDWLDQLKEALRKDGWHTLRTSRDLVLDQEQTDVNMAVDMDIARQAAVFIGNGWSSYTSNIVHRRMIDDRKSTVSSFYGGPRASFDPLNSDFPASSQQHQQQFRTQQQGTFRGRDDASSFFSPERTGQPNSAGYNRNSFFNAGREEPLKGGRDEEDGQRGAWDVYADFNNTGPRYSSAFGNLKQDNGYRQISTPASPMIKEEDIVTHNGNVEMVTVPALGPEWQKDEMRKMTKAGRNEGKWESRKEKWRAWNRGQTGMCGRHCTRRTFAFTMFGLCAAIALVLGFTIPRVPAFSIHNSTPLLTATDDWGDAVPVGFSRAPANFSFPAYAYLEVNTDSNWLPLTFNSIHAQVFDMDTTRLVGTGDIGRLTLPAKTFSQLHFPLNFSYLATNDSDQTWKNWYESCRNRALYSDGVRPSLKFRLHIEMSIAGLPKKASTSTQVNNAECPIELAQNAA
ncbi:hypothetical protein AX16_008008 [Volvariella volvacea WC 439]|nr:hypothetical protein AX16_008008 [Volvariella volvacea WC 439]